MCLRDVQPIWTEALSQNPFRMCITAEKANPENISPLASVLCVVLELEPLMCAHKWCQSILDSRMPFRVVHAEWKTVVCVQEAAASELQEKGSLPM